MAGSQRTPCAEPVCLRRLFFFFSFSCGAFSDAVLLRSEIVKASPLLTQPLAYLARDPASGAAAARGFGGKPSPSPVQDGSSLVPAASDLRQKAEISHGC